MNLSRGRFDNPKDPEASINVAEMSCPHMMYPQHKAALRCMAEIVATERVTMQSNPANNFHQSVAKWKLMVGGVENIKATATRTTNPLKKDQAQANLNLDPVTRASWPPTEIWNTFMNPAINVAKAYHPSGENVWNTEIVEFNTVNLCKTQPEASKVEPKIVSHPTGTFLYQQNPV